MGTIDYMAPEQWEDSHEVDIRADIYSLGCTLYHLLAGSPPFATSEEPNMIRQMYAHTLAPVPPIREKRSDVPEALAAVIHRTLAKSRTDRQAVPAEVAAALDPFAADCDLSNFLKCNTVRTDRPHRDSAAPLSRATDRPSRRAWITSALTLTVAGAGGALWYLTRPTEEPSAGPAPLSGPPVRVGVLHSLSGTMALSEKPVVDATLLAIDEINKQGGVLGRPVEAVVEDGASDWPTFARLADKLITKDKVSTVFGCWTSASRKTVKPLFEQHDHLLFYPVQYEGLENSPNIIYTGAAPNQQILPAVKWCCSFLGKKRLFLVGSDYVFPRCANAIIRDQAAALGGEIIGEEYLLLGSQDTAGVVTKIAAAQPDIILNTINGDANVAFFRGLRAAGITAEKIPTISFSLAEEELTTLDTKDLVGDYAACNYFMSINRPQNHAFVRRFQAKFGPHRVTTDPMEAAYFGVHLWAKAVEAAGSTDVRAIRRPSKARASTPPRAPSKSIRPRNTPSRRSASARSWTVAVSR